MSLPKMKTNKVAAKRFKVTGTGRVLHRCVGMNHLLAKKSARRKRRLRLGLPIHPGVRQSVRDLIPYK